MDWSYHSQYPQQQQQHVMQPHPLTGNECAASEYFMPTPCQDMGHAATGPPLQGPANGSFCPSSTQQYAYSSADDFGIPPEIASSHQHSLQPNNEYCPEVPTDQTAFGPSFRDDNVIPNRRIDSNSLGPALDGPIHSYPDELDDSSEVTQLGDPPGAPHPPPPPPPRPPEQLASGKGKRLAKSQHQGRSAMEGQENKTSLQSTKSLNKSLSLTALERKLSREEKRRRRRASVKYRTAHATRERLRVEAFNGAFCTLRQLLPTLPPDKKLSKIEILRLAICYITYLNNVLDPDHAEVDDDMEDVSMAAHSA